MEINTNTNTNGKANTKVSESAVQTDVQDGLASERAYLAAEHGSAAAERARLADLDYVRTLAAKAGARSARNAFMRRVDALRGK